MNRKYFLSSMVSAFAGLPLMANNKQGIQEFLSDAQTGSIIPPYLKKGDLIGITAPAGFITPEEVQPAISMFEEWGYKVKQGNSIGKRDFTFGGTDDERRADLQQMLDDPGIKAIMCARGGYGAIRILDHLDFKKFIHHPKWILGFSDITVLHCHINRQYGIATIHSKMCNSFPFYREDAEPDQKESIDSIHQCLSGQTMSYTAIPNRNNRTGVATGQLVGGNLKIIETLAGSSSDLVTRNKILFVEDTGEYLYSIDRMFWNLKRTGKLAGLKGLIIGGFKIKPDEEGEVFGKSLEEIVLEKVIEYDYPVCFDFPAGHQKNNRALKCGVLHRMEVNDEKVIVQCGK